MYIGPIYDVSEPLCSYRVPRSEFPIFTRQNIQYFAQLCAPRHKKIWITQYACFVIAYIYIYIYVHCIYIYTFHDFFRGNGMPIVTTPLMSISALFLPFFTRDTRYMTIFDFDFSFGNGWIKKSFKIIIVSIDFGGKRGKIGDKLSDHHSLLHVDLRLKTFHRIHALLTLLSCLTFSLVIEYLITVCTQ